jgi:L-asparaginase
VKSTRPVVITGAMRPPTSVGTDADLNLLDAIRLAAAPEAAGRGVLTILNNEIQSARDVTKSNAFRVDTFHSRDFGLLGYVDSDARVLFYRSVTRPHTTATPFDVRGRTELPRVDIVHAYAGADGVLVDALTERRPAGMVLVGFGGGSFPAAFLDAGRRALKAGIPAVLATRSWNGRVVSTPKKDADGFIVCDDLMPQKARILLMLALTVTRERGAIRGCSTSYEENQEGSDRRPGSKPAPEEGRHPAQPGDPRGQFRLRVGAHADGPSHRQDPAGHGRQAGRHGAREHEGRASRRRARRSTTW